MHYRTLGRTGIEVSILGFGAMRLPKKPGEKRETNHEESIKIIRKAIDSGVNIIDTAYIYGDSEIVVGKALKDGYREKVVIQTKVPVWQDEFSKPELFEKCLEEELKKLDVDCIDIYLFHGLKGYIWRDKVLKMNLLDLVKKAKSEGKIKHVGFSFHDTPEALKEIVDSNEFEVMLVQYNFLDTRLEEVIQYAAAEKGLGVAIMGPVGGGRLGKSPPDEMKDWVTKGRDNFVVLALKFVWSHPGVTVALSGMGSEQMVDKNLALASNETITLTKEERERVKKIAQRYKELTDVYCTQCGYCMLCPNGVNIPFIFEHYANWQIHQWIYGKIQYSNLGPYHLGKKADACIECVECEPKCPQNIPIIKQLKKAHEVLSN
ncbi:MAG: aldo/keto reductase [Candidatus Heimdallarchaeota archaeon]